MSLNVESLEPSAVVEPAVDRVAMARELPAREAAFYPLAPKSLAEASLNEVQVEALLIKNLLHRGIVSGRKLSEQVALPYNIVAEILRRLKTECLVSYRSSSSLGDYEYELTGTGIERAHRFNAVSSYHGAAPVSLADYEHAVASQSILSQRPGPGQAVRSARAMFLYGAAGNGKTSIAERLSRSYGKSVWIPRVLNFDGEMVRVFDPIMHIEDPLPDVVTALKPNDQRWVRIRRPTVIAGGEMTLANLELTPVPVGGVNEAPLQVKANGGVFVIDDFGRQRVSTSELLNRWIVPLERRFDFLDSPGGRKVKVPFDQFVVFSTNLDPDKLVDEAFLRRIPYKVELCDPTEEQFHRIFQAVAPGLGLSVNPAIISDLIATHYRAQGLPFRACHARDLLQQVVTLCEYNSQAPVLTRDTLFAAVKNYFARIRS
jgi:hypothetical protein